MKIIHTSDILSILSCRKLLAHLKGSLFPVENISPGEIDEKISSILQSFDKVVDHAVLHQADLVVIAGDTIKVYPPEEVLQEFRKRLVRLDEAGIKVVINGNNSGLYQELNINNVFVIREPGILNLETRNGNIQVIGIPEGNKDFSGTLERLLKATDETAPVILVTNVSVEQSTIGAEQYLEPERSTIIPLSDLCKPPVKYAALGGSFKHQILSSSPVVTYSGTIDKIHRVENKESKGFMEVVINGEEIMADFVEL